MTAATELPTLAVMDTARKLDDLVDLVALGESWLRACAILGWTPETASRAAFRHGRGELAGHINRALTGEPDA